MPGGDVCCDCQQHDIASGKVLRALNGGTGGDAVHERAKTTRTHMIDHLPKQLHDNKKGLRFCSQRLRSPALARQSAAFCAAAKTRNFVREDMGTRKTRSLVVTMFATRGSWPYY